MGKPRLVGLLVGQKIVVASHNAGKLRELRTILKPFDVEIVGAAELGLKEPVEDGDSFEANARIKATSARDSTGFTAISDDSGLVVPALKGSPGIYSARWAGPESNYYNAMMLIEEQLGSLDKNAHFTCALAVALPSGACCTFLGQVFGQLCFPPRGERGFGYDPIFQPAGFSETFGEMEPEIKHTISHRAQAFGKMQCKFL
jgi:XTP/dITP diphosphohydrolase